MRVLSSVLIGMAFSLGYCQTASISVDQGSGAEYAVGDEITLEYSVSEDANVEVFDVLPSGEQTLIDAREAVAGEAYRLTGVVSLPLGVEAFELRAVTTSGEEITASTFIRVIAGTDPWEWLSQADIAQASLRARDVFFSAPRGMWPWGIHASPDGGLFVVLVPEGDCAFSNSYGNGVPSQDETVINYVSANGNVAEVARGHQTVFTSSARSSSLYLMGDDGIDELNLTTGVKRQISDFDQRISSDLRRSCSSANLGVATIDNDSALFVTYPPSRSCGRAAQIFRIRLNQYSSADEVARYDRCGGGGTSATQIVMIPDREARVLLCSRDCMSYDIPTETVGPDFLNLSAGVNSVVMSPSGGVVLAADSNNRVWVSRFAPNEERANLLTTSTAAKAPSVAWDFEERAIYWVDGRHIYRGDIAAPTKVADAEPAGQARACPDGTFMGVSLEEGSYGTYVRTVSEGPAYSAGIRRGDTLVTLDGHDLLGLGPYEVAELIPQVRRSIHVSVWRGWDALTTYQVDLECR